MRKEKKKSRTDKDLGLSRRRFISRASATGVALGASLALGKSVEALAESTSSQIYGKKDDTRHGLTKGFDPTATHPLYPPRAQPKLGEKVHEFDIELNISIHEIVPGVKMHAFTYNGSYPGPEIRVTEGDWVLVSFTNKTSELHTIHWHGIQLACEMDGVPLGTQWPVGKNQTFKYLFRAQPAGTHFYHCHNMTTLHVQAGMFGALIIEPKEDPIKKVFPFDREYTLVLSEVDTNFIQRQMNEMMKEMDVMFAMNQSPKLMKEMNGRMMGWFKNKKAFVDAVKSGYVPPYTVARTEPVKPPNFNYFMINGKSYPMTDELLIRMRKRSSKHERNPPGDAIKNEMAWFFSTTWG